MTHAGADVRHRQRRTLVTGGCAILAILTIGRGIPALTHWRAERLRDAADLRAEWRRAAADIGSAAAVQEATRTRQLDLGQTFPSLLHGVTIAAASGSLMEFVSEAADDSGVRLGAVDVRPDTSGRGVYIRITASTEASGDVRGITQFLADLEGGELRLRVRELRITQPEPYAAPAHPEALHLSLVLEGLARRPVTTTSLAAVSRGMAPSVTP